MHILMVVALLAAIDPGPADRAFQELRAMCAVDDGRLWGVSLCGPTVFVDPRTREAMTERGARVIPESIGIANTAVDWEGEHWTMVMWPLPSSTVSRRVLLAHESFHRIQKDLGLPAVSPANAHLDSPDARRWMRLEWRALARALATGEADAVADALAFRAERRAIAKGRGDEERQLEINEGLAEYTGWALAVPHRREPIAPLVGRLARADANDAMSRSFAYSSGPAWGTLIEMRDPRWTRRIRATDDLGELARRAWRLPRVTPIRAERYQGEAIRTEEESRAKQKRDELELLRRTFIDGPILVLPLEAMSFTFDPGRVQPLGEQGTVYRSLEVRDVWGVVKAGEGGLISTDFRRLVIPEGTYQLTLGDGWRIAEGSRGGERVAMRR